MAVLAAFDVLVVPFLGREAVTLFLVTLSDANFLKSAVILCLEFMSPQLQTLPLSIKGLETDDYTGDHNLLRLL